MITVIDLSSDDETPTPIQKGISVVSPTPTTQEQRNQRVGQHCQTSPPKSKRLKNDNDNSNTLKDVNDLDFIDHVVMTWLNRVRSGYRNVEMPDNILKAKAKEAASLLKVHNQFPASSWLTRFQEKMKLQQELKQNTNDAGKSQVFRIEEIIKEEKPKFLQKKTLCKSNEKETSQLKEFQDNQQNRLAKMLEEQKKRLENVKEKQRQQMEHIKHAQKQRSEYLRQQEEEMRKKIIEHQKMEQITIPVPSPPASATKLRFGVLRKPGAVPNKPPPEPETVTLFEVIEVDDVLDEPIQSYEEALDCLALVENYFLSTRNLKAVMFVNQIETFLKKQLEL